MHATLTPATVSNSGAAAIASLRDGAAAVRDAAPIGSPQHAYASTLLSVLDVLDTCRINGHVALIGELWRTARQTAERLSACPKLSTF